MDPGDRRINGGATPASTDPAVRTARIMAVANQKGGVGKSTTAVSLGAALAEAGHRVLVIDLDPQGNASTGLGIRHESRDVTVYDVLAANADIRGAVVETPVPNLFAVPSTIDLAGAEIELVSQFSREMRLRRALDPIRVGAYDFILLDCPPSLGLLTINALAAAEELIVPIQCEYYALEGLGQLLRNVRLVQQNVNPGLRLSGIVMTMFDPRTKLSEQVVDEVRKFFGDLVYATVIPRTVRLSEAPGFGQPITLYDPRSRGAECYRDLATEVARRPAQEGPLPTFEEIPNVSVVIEPVVPPPTPARSAPRPLRETATVEAEIDEPEPEDEETAEPDSPLRAAGAGEPAKPAGVGEPAGAAADAWDAARDPEAGEAPSDAEPVGTGLGVSTTEQEDGRVEPKPSQEHRPTEAEARDRVTPAETPAQRSGAPGAPPPAGTGESGSGTPDGGARAASPFARGARKAPPHAEREVVVIDAYGLDPDAASQPEVEDDDLVAQEDEDGGRKRWSLFRRGGNR
jgi:chromosome partitioning protein